MKWKITPKECIIKRKFAWLPKRIGDYKVWLSFYYESHKLENNHYIPIWFLTVDDAKAYFKDIVLFG